MFQVEVRGEWIINDKSVNGQHKSKHKSEL